MDELRRMLDNLAVDAGHRTDYLNAVESTLMGDKIKSRLLPTNQPVNVAYNSSSFGWRLDPSPATTPSMKAWTSPLRSVRASSPRRPAW
jgi:hypothetical protein